MTRDIRLVLLGGFDLFADPAIIRLPSSAARLLAYLALHRGPVVRSTVSGALWPDIDEERARRSIRTALWRLGSRSTDVVRVEGERLSLRETVGVDIDEAERLMFPTLQVPPSGISGELRRCLLTDLLPGWSDEWLVAEQRRYGQLRFHAIETLADWYIQHGRFTEALEIASHVISAEPFRETAHRCFLRALVAEGNRGEAHRHFEHLRVLFLTEIGVEPSFGIDELAVVAS